MSDSDEIDWSAFDGKAENICTCRCVFETLHDGDEIPTFRSHITFRNGQLHLRKPCPRCGRIDNVKSATSISIWETY